MSQIPEWLADVLPTRAKTLQFLETLAIGTVGGVLFLVVGLPGGLISGAMLAVASAAMLGRQMAVPAHLTQAVLVMLTLGLAASSILLLTRHRWPHLWSLAQPPGLGFARPSRPLYLALAIAVGVAAPLLGGQLTQWFAHGQTVSQDIQQLGADTPLTWRMPLVLVVVSLGPVVEELLFRGVLMSALMQRWQTGWAMAASSLVFALVHLPGLQWQWFALPDLLLLALLLAWLRLRSGSIWPGVLAHGINNLLAVAAWFVVAHLSG